jgi:hypothetical protein
MNLLTCSMVDVSSCPENLVKEDALKVERRRDRLALGAMMKGVPPRCTLCC